MSRPVVVKVGGSLLAWRELPARLADYLAPRRGERLVLVAGGGAAADVVRTLDRVHDLGQERAHQLALHALDLTAHALAALVPARVVTHVAALPGCWHEGVLPVLAPRLFLHDDDRSPGALPHTWDATSDSIAARVARAIDAGELVLLKSAPLPPGTDRLAAARLGLVDPVFPSAAREIERVAYVGLREPTGEGVPVTI